jgi:hypothetical protein
VAVVVAGRRLIPFSGSMTALFVALLASLRATIRSRLELAAEILALRHPLAVLQRSAPKRPRLRRIDRLLWMLLSSVWPNWRAGAADRDAGHGGALASPRVRRLLLHLPHIPVLVRTGTATSAFDLRSFGPLGVMRKPLDIDAIVSLFCFVNFGRG